MENKTPMNAFRRASDLNVASVKDIKAVIKSLSKDIRIKVLSLGDSY